MEDMEIEVYADLLFLINAGMDGLCFFLTGHLLHVKLSPWRVLLGAAIGGAYAVFALFPDTGQALSLICDVAVCLVLCAVVFLNRRSGEIGRLLLSTAVYALLSMALGGVMTALYNLFNRIGLNNVLPEGEDGIGAWLFALLAFFGSIITLFGGRFFSRASTVEPCRITVKMEGRSVEMDGLIDTGNLLRDPLSGRLVICADRRLLTSLLSPNLALAIRDSQMAVSLSPQDARRLRLIPAGSATGQRVLTGFVPDEIHLLYVRKGKEIQKCVQAVIAATDLTSTQALIPAELLN
jgi:stage II sporulation protein GA (sporulation sigma-E factor processing peptidase)